jgi:uncharacterized protein DUF4167
VRQGQQNRRGRGRNNNNNNNNRKGHHNPLSRSFESNGPDVKIRGTPAHIAEKYISLARDAQSTGDPVLAENYLQHAEHYSRIIMAYREQFNQPGEGGANGGGGPRMRGLGEEGFDDFGDDPDAGADDGFPQPFVPQPPQQHQQPREPRPQHTAGEHQPRAERPDRPFRRDQNRPRYGDRPERGDRQGFTERDRGEPRSEPRPEPQDRGSEQVAEAVAEPRRRDRFQQVHEQPEFLRRPVRRARSDNGGGEPGKSEPTE